MLPTFKPRIIWEGSRDKPGVKTGLGKSDCPGLQGGSGKRGLLQVGARTQFLSRQHVRYCYDVSTWENLRVLQKWSMADQAITKLERLMAGK